METARRAAVRPDALSEIAARSAAQMSAENFPVALRILPKRPRSALAAVYRYARFVDDVGDEAAGDRLALLDVVEAEVHDQWRGRSSSLAPVAGLRPWIESMDLAEQPFLDLVEANRVDQRRGAYADFADLMGYCRLSAAPVGRIVLRIADADTERNVADSDTVCNALQVLEHCQDVGEDARAGRTYLPQADLAAAAVPVADLLAATTSPALRTVIGQQVDRAVDMLRAGRPLTRRLSGWAKLAVSGYVAGGLATADALRAADYDVLAAKIGPSKLRTAAYAIRTLVTR